MSYQETDNMNNGLTPVIAKLQDSTEVSTFRNGGDALHYKEAAEWFYLFSITPYKVKTEWPVWICCWEALCILRKLNETAT